MLLVSEEEAKDLIDQATDNAAEAGITIRRFPIEPHNVLGIHTHMKGFGDGIWFRSYTEQVFNSLGERCPSERSLYDTTTN